MKGRLPLVIMKTIDFNSIGGILQDDIGLIFEELGGIDFSYVIFENSYMVSNIVVF